MEGFSIFCGVLNFSCLVVLCIQFGDLHYGACSLRPVV